jgi:hypothetical protein
MQRRLRPKLPVMRVVFIILPHFSTHFDAGQASADIVPIEERLFHEADNRDAIRERARRWASLFLPRTPPHTVLIVLSRYKEEQELSKTCTFKPNVEHTGACFASFFAAAAATAAADLRSLQPSSTTEAGGLYTKESGSCSDKK